MCDNSKKVMKQNERLRKEVAKFQMADAIAKANALSKPVAVPIAPAPPKTKNKQEMADFIAKTTKLPPPVHPSDRPPGIGSIGRCVRL
jgi:hypothetical protein